MDRRGVATLTEFLLATTLYLHKAGRNGSQLRGEEPAERWEEGAATDVDYV